MQAVVVHEQESRVITKSEILTIRSWNGNRKIWHKVEQRAFLNIYAFGFTPLPNPFYDIGKLKVK